MLAIANITSICKQRISNCFSSPEALRVDDACTFQAEWFYWSRTRSIKFIISASCCNACLARTIIVPNAAEDQELRLLYVRHSLSRPASRTLSTVAVPPHPYGRG